MTKETGGPAFPVPAELCQDLTVEEQRGMTLRDYFAAKAMQAHITSMRGLPPNHEWKLDAAKLAYGMADEMIEARK